VDLPIVKVLKEELKKVDRELRFDVPKDLAEAAAHGASLTSLRVENIPKDIAGFGSKVFLEDVNTGAEVVYELVTPEEVDPRQGKISVSSPVGKALLNKQEGDEVTVNLPTGVREYEVTGLETIHERFPDD
jgi:transcription elongation factor GreA